MARLVWDNVGERYFEAGVDRGVLYPMNSDGVAWNGLLSVDENPDGGDSNAYYIDGIKYLNRVSPVEYAATIKAFSYPDEFAACDGTIAMFDGLLARHQPRQPFHLSYRTKLGNDLEGIDYGYKIHLIYNALAKPSDRSYGTIDDSPTAMDFSWDITTTPIPVRRHRPTAHFEIVSTATDPDTLAKIEDILYGVDDVAPRIILPDELIVLFSSSGGDVFSENFGATF